LFKRALAIYQKIPGAQPAIPLAKDVDAALAGAR